MVTQDTVGSGLYVGRDYEGRENLLALGHSRGWPWGIPVTVWI